MRYWIRCLLAHTLSCRAFMRDRAFGADGMPGLAIDAIAVASVDSVSDWLPCHNCPMCLCVVRCNDKLRRRMRRAHGVSIVLARMMSMQLACDVCSTF